MRLTLSALLLTGLHLLAPTALAQTSTAPPAAQAALAQPVVTGKTLEGQAFDLAKLKGRVVMLMFWSTECAI